MAPEPQLGQVSERKSEGASESDMVGLVWGQHPPNPDAGQEGKTEGHSLVTPSRKVQILPGFSYVPV